MAIDHSYFTAEELTTFATDMALHYRISICAVVLLTLIIANRSDSPKNRGKWHDPCGGGNASSIEPRIPTNKRTWNKELDEGLGKIRRQLSITISHYQKQRYNTVYKQVRKGVDKKQYVPTWLPGEGNVRVLYDKTTRRKVSGYLPSLHTELQKFAIAMEAVIETDPKSASLNDTNSWLIQLLCEVEEVMVVLQIGVPTTVERAVMSDEQRHPKDETHRLIRDWGVLSMYRDYLHLWRNLLLKVEKRDTKLNREQKPEVTK